VYAWKEEGGEHVERRDVCLREVGSRGFSIKGEFQRSRTIDP